MRKRHWQRWERDTSRDEKETLAVVFGCEKFRQYVYGRTVEVETDHKLLQPIFNKPLHQTPARLQRLLLQPQMYDLRMTYKPRKGLVRCRHSQPIVSPRDKRGTCLRSRNQPKVVLAHLTRNVRTVPERNCERRETDRTEQCDPQKKAWQQRPQRRHTSISQTVPIVQRRTSI